QCAEVSAVHECPGEAKWSHGTAAASRIGRESGAEAGCEATESAIVGKALAVGNGIQPAEVGPGQRPRPTQWNSAGRSRAGSETRCHTMEFGRQKSGRVRDPVPHDGIQTAGVRPGQRPGPTRWNSDGRSRTGSETRSHTMEFGRQKSDRVRDPVPHDGIQTAEVAPGQRPGLTRWNSDSRSRTGSETRCHTMEFSRQ